MTELVQYIRQLAADHGHDPGKRLGVAFSGGVDSTALLKLAVEAFEAEYVVALHVDHGVRPQSADDKTHCETTAETLGVEFRATRLQSDVVAEAIRERGREGAFRHLRYEALAEMCEAVGVETLFVGHHGEDRVESHLLAMVRGSGLTGLAGPRMERLLAADLSIRLLRPLLETPKARLHEIVGETPFVEDETNQDTTLSRNRIRHEVMPVLTDMAGSSAPLMRSVELLAQERDDLERLLAVEMRRSGLDPSQDMLDFSTVEDCSSPLVSASLRSFFRCHGANYPPTRKMLGRVIDALGEPGRTRFIDAPKFRLRVSQRRVHLEPPQGREEGELPAVRLAIGRSAKLGRYSVGAEIGDVPTEFSDANRVFFDLDDFGDDILLDLELRTARPGDRFRPFGVDGSVRLFRWLASQQVELDRRPGTLLVVGGNEILWVVGLRRSQLAPVTKRTERVLVFEVTYDDIGW